MTVEALLAGLVRTNVIASLAILLVLLLRPFVLRWLNHPSYDRFWQSLVPYGREFAKVDIPVLTITGYYAAGEGGALYYFKEHHRYDPHANHTLLIGPYDNGVTERGVQPVLRGYTVDQAALVDLRELRYAWFDSVLKGAQTPAMLQGRAATHDPCACPRSKCRRKESERRRDR